ncbi:putative RNA-directed DNA polymerase [Tanacetum coccineum]
MPRWVRPEVYPLMAAMTFVTSMCVFQLSRNVFMNPDVRVNKAHRTTAVLENQDEGEKYAEHGLRRLSGITHDTSLFKVGAWRHSEKSRPFRAKILAERLKKVIDKLFGEVQSAFIKDRFILDGVLLVNKVVDFIKKLKNSCFIFKVDFEKAYDCVNWEFLYEVMSQMGFERKWCGWIRECLETATYSILVNGTPTKEFVLQRGIRQGGPLSPFLFLIVAEGLNIMMQEVLNRDLFEGIKIGSDEVCLTHLQYADDTIFIGKWNRNNIINLMKLLKCFQLVSGLKVNLNKSKLYGIGIEMEEIEDYARSLECRAGKLPFLYLGLPIGNNMGRIENWNIMVDKFKSKLADWKAKMISFGGRLTLVKSVLGGTGDSKHMVWINWEKALSSYGVGGLNIGSLKAMNWAMLSKWWWRFRVENEALWVKVIKSLYGAGGGLQEENISFTGNSVWGNIVKVGRDLGKIGINLASTIKWEVGDGKAILFWDDTWVGGRRLRDQFPRWKISDDGKFSVKVLRDLIDEKTLGSTGRQFITPWCKSIPKKVLWKRVFGWWGLENIDVFSVEDDLNLSDINSFNGINRERWKAVIWSTLYIIWSNRNQMIFRRNGSMIPDLFKEVQLRSFEWISARSKKKDEVKWEEWFGGPTDHV